MSHRNGPSALSSTFLAVLGTLLILISIAGIVVVIIRMGQ
jgi:hypothetical protein